MAQTFANKEYWMTITITDRFTPWKDSIQQTTTKDEDGNTLKTSWRVFSTHFRWSVIATLLLLIITERLFVQIWDHSSPNFMGDDNYVCQSPRVIHPWHITAFRPRWFGLFGDPAPITYRTKGRHGHRVSIVDIDKRDIEIEMWVDNKDFGYRPVDLNSTVDCGDDLVRCLSMGFGAAMISVPPGKHLVKAQILDAKGTFNWGDQRRRRVWWMAEQCS